VVAAERLVLAGTVARLLMHFNGKSVAGWSSVSE